MVKKIVQGSIIGHQTKLVRGSNTNVMRSSTKYWSTLNFISN